MPPKRPDPTNVPPEPSGAQEGAGGRQRRAVLRGTEERRPGVTIPRSALLAAVLVGLACWALLALLAWRVL